MNIHDRSSLLLVPSGYKDGKLYSQVPNSGDGDFTFTRGSNLAATRVGADGLIEKGRENILLQSNNFADTSAWVQGNLTRTQGELGYDGTNDAWEIVRSATGSIAVTNTTTSTGVVTFSLYIKVNPSNGIGFCFNGSTSDKAFFNISDTLQTSPVEIGGGVFAASINYIGNNWYRISASYNGSNSGVQIRCLSADGSVFTSGATYIVQDAQLEAGLVATDYIESGATTGKAGILENQPRLDYSGGASRASLLLEPSRTNLVTNSEYFDAWNKIGSPTITNNYGISPEGLQNSTRLQTTSDRITFSVGTINANETFSIYMKGSGTLRIQVGDENFYPSVTNEWVRYEFKTTQASVVSNIQIRGDGSAVDVELYGAQYERNSYPTSYIPTYGASATRSSETAAKTIPSLVDTNSCTMLLEVDLPQGREGSDNFVQLNGNSTCGWKGNYTPSPIIQLNGSGTISDSSTFSLSTGVHKLLFKWYNGTAEIFIDGVKQSSTITDSAAPTVFNGVNYTGSGYRTFQKQLVIFPTALSDTDCELLTGTTYESFAAMAEALNYTVYE